MSKQRTWYMHTISGRPAAYDGEQIVYAGGRHAAMLVPSRARVIREAQASRRWRIRNGFDKPSDPYLYGYVLVRLPE